LLPVLLSLFCPRVAAHKPCLFEPQPELRIQLDQSARQPVAHRAGLTRDAASIHVDVDVILAYRIGQVKRLPNDHSVSLVRKIVVKLPLVDRDLARTGSDEYPGSSALAPPCPVVLNRFRHAVSPCLDTKRVVTKTASLLTASLLNRFVYLSRASLLKL